MAPADATVARLKAAIASVEDGPDVDEDGRRRALEALAKLEPATLAQQAEAFVAMFSDANLDEAAELARLGLEDDAYTLNQRAWSELAMRLTMAAAALAKMEDPPFCDGSVLYVMLELVGPEALAMLSDDLVSLLETSEACTRLTALISMQALKPATFAQYADAVIARLEDSDWDCRRQALETLRLKLNPSTLAQHADAILARLVDEINIVRSEALRTLEMLEPLALAQHADAVVARLVDESADVRHWALPALAKLELATLAQHAEAVVARLEDTDWWVRSQALIVLGKLEPATLARHADSVAARLEDDDGRVRKLALIALRKLEPARFARYATDVFRMFDDENEDVIFDDANQKEDVRRMAWSTLGVLPRSVFDPGQFDAEHGDSMRNYLMGRVGWYRLRLRLRLKCLLLYWYALPYRPSGAGHARDVEAWDQMSEVMYACN